VQNAARDAKNPGLSEIIEMLRKFVFDGPDPQGLQGEIRNLSRVALVYHLMALASDQRAAPTVRSIAFNRLQQIASYAQVDPWLKHQIKRFEDDPKTIPLPRPLEAPPGMPIGDDEAPLW